MSLAWSNTEGLMLILSAPSGAGKTTLAHMLLDSAGGIFSVSYTTRLPRGREVDGVDYHFVDESRFRLMAGRGEFVEWAEVYGRLYGTHMSYVEAAKQGKLVLFDVDLQGGLAIKKKYPEAISVYILPPSMEALEQRLRDRRTDSDEAINKRLQAARAELEIGCALYDYLLINRELDQAFTDLAAIVKAELCRRSRVDVSGFGLKKKVPST